MARIRSVKPGLFGSQVVDVHDLCKATPSSFYPEHEVILYRFYDARGALLYVGVTGRLAERWTAHRRTAPWWGQIAELVTEKYSSMESALSAERSAIRSELPRYNRRSAA